MKVKIEIEINCDYSSVHFSEEKMRETLFEYPDKIKREINDRLGSLYFNGMAMASIHANYAKIISYSNK